ncbi:cobalamin biosynthesis protein CobD, partial [Salmonella enterica subsp. enterica serovar Poona]
MTILAWCIAWVLDFIIGDPQHWPHPVRWIGRLITFVQRIVRRYCPGDKALRIGGGVRGVVVGGATWGVAWGVLALAQRIHPWFGWSVEVWMIFTTLAGRSLAHAAQEVERPLRKNDLAESRIKLSWIVGRDTSQLQPAQINRAVVDTVGANPVYGSIAPLYIRLRRGAPGARA